MESPPKVDNYKLKDLEKKIKGLEDLLKVKDDEISSLKTIEKDYNEIKG